MDLRHYRFLEIVDNSILRFTENKDFEKLIVRKSQCYRKTHPSPPVIRIDFLAVGVLILLLSIDPRLSETSVDAMNLTGPACP